MELSVRLNFEELIYLCQKADEKSDNDFFKIINFSIYNNLINETDLTVLFGVGYNTVFRWKMGESTPHPAMRSVFYKLILKISSHMMTEFICKLCNKKHMTTDLFKGLDLAKLPESITTKQNENKEWYFCCVDCSDVSD